MGCHFSFSRFVLYKFEELHKGYVRSREIIFGGKLRRRQHLFPTIFTHITQLRLTDLFCFPFLLKAFFFFSLVCFLHSLSCCRFVRDKPTAKSLSLLYLFCG